MQIASCWCFLPMNMGLTLRQDGAKTPCRWCSGSGLCSRLFSIVGNHPNRTKTSYARYAPLRTECQHSASGKSPFFRCLSNANVFHEITPQIHKEVLVFGRTSFHGCQHGAANTIPLWGHFTPKLEQYQSPSNLVLFYDPMISFDLWMTVAAWIKPGTDSFQPGVEENSVLFCRQILAGGQMEFL